LEGWAGEGVRADGDEVVYWVEEMGFGFCDEVFGL
jgi:hypothetical protein